MSKDNSQDYVFHLNWEDRYKNSFRVGILAEIDNIFYLVVREPKNAETAYSKGFVGIPGIKPGELYTSLELFDFFKSRILDKKSPNPCKELAISGGTLMTDSFSLEEINEKLKPKYTKSILKIKEISSKKNQLRPQNSRQSNAKDASTFEQPQI